MSEAAVQPDPAVARAERRLALLEELAEIGMEIARALKPGNKVDQPPQTADPAEAFARVSRAVRLTLALEAKTEAELADLKAGVVRERETTAAQFTERRNAYIEDASERVLVVVDAEARDKAEHDNLFEALTERLELDEAYFDCARRPLRETVERLCRDLELSPDWSLWEGDGWSLDAPPVRPRFSPFCRPSRKPLLDENGEPLAVAEPPKRRLE